MENKDTFSISDRKFRFEAKEIKKFTPNKNLMVSYFNYCF